MNFKRRFHPRLGQRFSSLIFIVCIAVNFVVPHRVQAESSLDERPNFIVIFCDDLGYGDLRCYGHPTIATPRLDRMADEGLRATQFYVAASVCTPSRAGLMTGRLPIRNGMCGQRRVLFPDSVGGLPASEVTMAEVLRDAGYRTAMVGKWHLGHLPEYLPTAHGFESYYGIPYSNDMDKINGDDPAKKGRGIFKDPDWRDFNVPLLQSRVDGQTREIERPVDQTTITRRYTEQSIQQIRELADQPFFLYLAHSLPHVPLFRSEQFQNHSAAGLYGDVIEEIDHGVGQILDTLEELEIDDQTLVVFTSDNGPWLTFNEMGGSAGPLRNGKGTTFDGGMRVPGIFRMPGTIAAGRTDAGLASTLDLLPTFAAMAKTDRPKVDGSDVVLDGIDLTSWLRGDAESPRESIFYYRDTRLMAIRHGDHKMHLITQDAYRRGASPVRHDPPLLYDLSIDLREQNDIAGQNASVLSTMADLIAEHQDALHPPASQLDRR